MPALSADERLAALKEKKRQLDAQITRLNARKSVEKRKQDTQRKIVAGAVVLKEAERDPKFRALLYQLLEKRLTLPRERLVFGFKVQSEEEANDNEQPAERASQSTV